MEAEFINESIHSKRFGYDTREWPFSGGRYSRENGGLLQWYSTFFFRVPPVIISLQLCTPKVVGV
jgi:hypothetical protein